MRPTLTLVIFSLFASYFNARAGNDFRDAGSRSHAMGGASVTFSDIFSLHNNQAGIAFIEDIGVGIYSENRFLLEGINLFTGAFALPTSSGVFGLSVDYFGFSSYNEKKIGLAYARKFGERFSAGLQFDYLSTSISEYGNRNNFTVEAGLLFEILPDLWIGTHVYNPIHSKLSSEEEEDIPITINFGGSYHFSNQLIVSAQVEKNIEENPSFQAGLEYAILDALHLRGGASTSPTRISFGVGFQIKNLNIDIAGNYHQLLGFSPSAALSFSFGK